MRQVLLESGTVRDITCVGKWTLVIAAVRGSLPAGGSNAWGLTTGVDLDKAVSEPQKTFRLPDDEINEIRAAAKDYNSNKIRITTHVAGTKRTSFQSGVSDLTGQVIKWSSAEDSNGKDCKRNISPKACTDEALSGTCIPLGCDQNSAAWQTYCYGRWEEGRGVP